MAERDLEPVPGVRVRIRALSRHAQHQINREAAVGQPGQDMEKAEHLTWVHCLVAPAVPTVEDAAALFGGARPGGGAGHQRRHPGAVRAQRGGAGDQRRRLSTPGRWTVTWRSSTPWRSASI